MKRSHAQDHPACMQCRVSSLSNHSPSYVNQGAEGCCQMHDNLLLLHLAESRLPRSKRRFEHLRTNSLLDTCMQWNSRRLTPQNWRILDRRTTIACHLSESSRWPRIVNPGGPGGCQHYYTAGAYSTVADCPVLHPPTQTQTEHRRNWHQTGPSCRLGYRQISTGLPRKLHAANPIKIICMCAHTSSRLAVTYWL